ncbi:sialic acid TRAP transporter permease protein SiaT [Peptococcaceae bacterium CEB3]|nr:sialic acid TRAP transporter permease protein SiaT [Peptococcaceae bacterium CEB3]
MRYLDVIVEDLGIAALILMIVIVSFSVFSRYVLKSTPPWVEDSALSAMVWFGFLSISYGMRTDAHIRVTVIDKLIPNAVFAKILDWFVWLMLLAFGIFLIVDGSEVCQLTATTIMPGLMVSSSWMFAAVPVSGIAIVLQLLQKVRKMV